MDHSSMERALTGITLTLSSAKSTWSARSAALRDLASLADDALGTSPSSPPHTSLTRALPTLAPHLAAAVSDLRSAVVRDACSAVSALARTLGPAFATETAAPLTPALLHASRVTIAVIAASADSAARTLFTEGARGVPLRTLSYLAGVVQGRGEKSHPAARAAAVEYVGLIIGGGVLEQIPDRIADELQQAIASGCVDQADFVRDMSRASWRVLRRADGPRAGAVLEVLPYSAKTKILAESKGESWVTPTALLTSEGKKHAPKLEPRRRPPKFEAVRTESLESLPRVRPPVAPKRETAAEPGLERSTGLRLATSTGIPSKPAKKDNPFAKRPARRSVAMGTTGPLLPPGFLSSPPKQSKPIAPSPPASFSSLPNVAVSTVAVRRQLVDRSNVSPRLREKSVAHSVPSASSDVSLSVDTDGETVPLLASTVQAPLNGTPMTGVRSSTALSPIPETPPGLSPMPNLATASIANSLSPSTPTNARADLSDDDDDFSSAQGSPTPVLSALQTPTPIRPPTGLGIFFEKAGTSPQRFLGSPLFPPTPEAVKAAARKARISFMCGPNVSPVVPKSGLPTYQMRIPPITVMLPPREVGRLSSSSSEMSSSASSGTTGALQEKSLVASGLSDSSADHTETTPRSTDRMSSPAAISNPKDVAVSALLEIGGMESLSVSNVQESNQADLTDSGGFTLESPDLSSPLATAFSSSSEQAKSALSHISDSSVNAYLGSCAQVDQQSAMPSESKSSSTGTRTRDPPPQSRQRRTPASTSSNERKLARAHQKPSTPPHRVVLAPRTVVEQSNHRLSKQRSSNEKSISATAAGRRAIGPKSSYLPRHGGAEESITTSPSLAIQNNATTKTINPHSKNSRQAAGNTPRSKGILECIRFVEQARTSSWQTRVASLSQFQKACENGDFPIETLDLRTTIRTVSVLSELTTDRHMKVVTAALDAIFALLLGAESRTGTELHGLNPLQAALEKRPQVLQRILLCLADSRASIRVAAERVMHSIAAQFRPEVRAMLIIRAVSSSFSRDPTRKSVVRIGTPKVSIAGCEHLLEAFRTAEASGDGFKWEPVLLLSTLLETMSALLHDRRADVRNAAGPIVVAAGQSLPSGVLNLAIDSPSVSLSNQDRVLLRHVISTSAAKTQELST